MTTKPKNSFHSSSYKDIFAFLLSSLFSLPVLIFLAIVMITYITLGDNATKSLVDQTHDRQLSLAISGAATVENFISLTSSSLANLAEIIEQSDGAHEEHLKLFTKNWANTPMRGVILVNKDGLITDYSGENKPTELNVADRDYFIWAKSAKSGDVFIGTPVIPRLGDQTEFIIPIASPIFDNGQFNGVVVSGISFNKLTTDYLNLLKFTESTRIYLIDFDGTMLYSPFPQIQGVNYLTYLEENSFPGSNFIKNNLAKRAQSNEPGKIKTILPDAQSKTITSFLISHAPIIVGDKHWTLAIATPTKDAVAFVGPLYLNQLGLIVTTFLILIMFIIRATKKLAYKQASEELRRQGK